MKDFKYPLNIQMFGEGEEPETPGDKKDSSGAEEPKVLTQADIDRAVSIAVNKRDEKHANDVAKAVEDAIKEERRQATLTEEERREEARLIAEQKFADKQKELDQKILRVDVGEVLVKRGLNPELLEYVLGTDLNDSIVKIDALSSVIDKQVESNIKAVVVKPGVPKTSTTVGTMTKAEIMSIKDDGERQKQISLHSELFNYK
ncbi:MAG: DUF4355 domain-containing protein [Erysipelothrix sp.]